MKKDTRGRIERAVKLVPTARADCGLRLILYG